MTLATLAGMTWLLDRFVEDVRGICHVALISADGLLLCASRSLPAERAEDYAAVAAGLISLTVGTARFFNGGRVRHTIIEMDAGYLTLMAVADGSSLVVMASKGCDVGHVGFEMALLVDRVGSARTPVHR